MERYGQSFSFSSTDICNALRHFANRPLLQRILGMLGMEVIFEENFGCELS